MPTYPRARDYAAAAAEHEGGRWLRIPLIGDANGVVVLLPDEPLTEENFDHLLNILTVMRPGLVARTSEDEE